MPSLSRLGKLEVVEVCHSIEGFHGAERALQFLAPLGPHSSDNASQGGEGAWAANNKMALVGANCDYLPERSRRIAVGRSVVPAGQGQQLHVEARGSADSLTQCTLLVMSTPWPAFDSYSDFGLGW